MQFKITQISNGVEMLFTPKDGEATLSHLKRVLSRLEHRRMPVRIKLAMLSNDGNQVIGEVNIALSSSAQKLEGEELTINLK